MSGTWAGNEGHVTVRHTASPMSTKGHSLYCTYYCDPVFISSIVWPILRIYFVFHSSNYNPETCHTKAKKHVKSKQKLCIWNPAKIKNNNKILRHMSQGQSEYRRNKHPQDHFYLIFFFLLLHIYADIFLLKSLTQATRYKEMKRISFHTRAKTVAPSGTRHLGLVLMYSWIKWRADQMLLRKASQANKSTGRGKYCEDGDTGWSLEALEAISTAAVKRFHANNCSGVSASACARACICKCTCYSCVVCARRVCALAVIDL